jgi:AAHS family benzoate transporter-like MFS transporter
VLTALIMVSQNVWHLAVLRFAAGIGLGVVLPSALSLVRRHTSETHSALVFCIVMSGMPVGGIIATVVAQITAPFGSWHLLFGISACVGVVLFVLVWFLVPRERAKPGASTAETTAPWSSLFTRATLPLLIAGVVATLFDLLAFYGVNTWLTQLMREFGMPLDNSLQITLVLNIGSVIGVIAAGAIAVRLGTRRMAAIAGLVSLIGLVSVASQSVTGWILLIVVALVGISTNTAQTLVNTLVSDSFGPSQRSAALGMSLGVGRLGAVIAPSLGGSMLGAGLGSSWVLVAFGVAALLGAVALIPFNTRAMEATRNVREGAPDVKPQTVAPTA